MSNAIPAILIRPPTAQDAIPLIELNRASTELYAEWVAPPTTEEAFLAYLERSRREDVCAMLVCLAEGDTPIGAITLSQIFYGPLQSAYMGYYISQAYAGRGYMQIAIGLMLDHAFGPLGLHRVEANIQPTNSASIALVRRLGFTREGFSKRYLHIAGDWRDHERWAMLSEDWALYRSTQQTSSGSSQNGAK